MNNLSLQVRVIHHIEIDESERAHPGCAKIKRQWGSQATRADTEHTRRFQLLLALHAHLGHDQVARVAQDFIVGEGCSFALYFRDGGHKNLRDNRQRFMNRSS